MNVAEFVKNGFENTWVPSVALHGKSFLEGISIYAANVINRQHFKGKKKVFVLI